MPSNGQSKCPSRGGMRIGAGRPKKNPRTMEEEGHGHKPIVYMDIPFGEELESAPAPPVKDYMLEAQHQIDMDTEDVYNETWEWLKKVKCAQFVSPQLLRNYAQTVARWIQCEHAISRYGFIAQRKSTGEPIRSPYVVMEIDYQKQINQLWFQIFQIVRENTTKEWKGAVEQDDMMERLLRQKAGRIQ